MPGTRGASCQRIVHVTTVSRSRQYVIRLDTIVTRRYRRVMLTETDLTEEAVLRQALERSGGSTSGAGKLLGVSRMTVWRRMKKYGIEIKRVVDRAA